MFMGTLHHLKVACLTQWPSHYCRLWVFSNRFCVQVVITGLCGQLQQCSCNVSRVILSWVLEWNIDNAAIVTRNPVIHYNIVVQYDEIIIILLWNRVSIVARSFTAVLQYIFTVKLWLCPKWHPVPRNASPLFDLDSLCYALMCRLRVPCSSVLELFLSINVLNYVILYYALRFMWTPGRVAAAFATANGDPNKIPNAQI